VIFVGWAVTIIVLFGKRVAYGESYFEGKKFILPILFPKDLNKV